MVWDVGTDAHMKSDEFSEKFQVGHVESKHLYCRFWTFEQGSLSMKLIQHLQHGFPKNEGRGGRSKANLENYSFCCRFGTFEQGLLSMKLI